MRNIQSSFFYKNLLLFLIPLLIPLLILGGFSSMVTKRYVEEELHGTNLSLLLQTREMIELIFDELDSLNLNFSSNPEIIELRRILSNDLGTIEYEDYTRLKTVQNIINSPANARAHINSIYVYFDNPQGRVLTTSEGLTTLDRFYDASWYDSYLQRTRNASHFWTETRQFRQFAQQTNPSEVLSVYRYLFVPGLREHAGVIVLNIRMDNLNQILDGLRFSPEHQLIVVNEDDEILFHKNDNGQIGSGQLNQLLGAGKSMESFVVDNTTYLASQVVSEKYQWRYISIVPHHVFYSVSTELRQITFALLGVSFLLGLALTYMLARQNFQRVETIVSIINRAENNEPFPELPASPKDEYTYITHNILKTFLEQKYLRLQLSERKYHFQVMELLALQSQINPHFVFNTIETIKWKTIEYTKGPNDASKMLEELAQILKYSLNSPGDTVPLAEEIRNTLSYIEILKLRYKDKFELVWDYDEEIVEQYRVLRLLLQPLIENAIYHGIKQKGQVACVKIRMKEVDNHLSISVVDNGVGIPADHLEAIREQLAAGSESPDHIGLFNTNRRLKLVYGEDYGLTIRSKEGYGTAVYMRVPQTTDEHM